MAAYRLEVIENGKSYKPVFDKDLKGYNNYWITKFLVMENKAKNIKLWTNAVDVNDENKAIDIPSSAFTEGKEYEIAIGKLTWEGELKILAYQTAVMPIDFPLKNI